MRHSSEIPSYPVGLFRHFSPLCHSDSRLGISTWETLKVSYRVYTGFLLQYTQYRYSIPRFATTFRGTRIVVTPDLIPEVLHVPRVAHLDYPHCEHLWTMSRNELLPPFCETPSIWGGKQNSPCLGFAKGPRFLNMVVTFTLTPLSHYNSITEPCAHFLLSLLEGLSIDFPSHFIISVLDVYQDTATRDKFIFPSAITYILTSPFLFLILLTSPLWVPSALVLFGGARPNFDRSDHIWRHMILLLLLLLPPSWLLPPLLFIHW